MIRAKRRYRNKTMELEQALPIAEGTDVEIDIHVGHERESPELETARQAADEAFQLLDAMEAGDAAGRSLDA